MNKLITTIALVLISIIISKVFAQTQISPKYSVDGAVNALVSKGDTLIIGGKFNNVGVYTGGAAFFQADTSGIPNLSFPKIIGSVSVSTDDGAGGFYIYGNYRKESEPSTSSGKRIDHIRSDFSFDPLFPSVTISASSINAMLFKGGLLYIGGNNVIQVGGHTAGDLSAINTATQALQSWIPTIDSGSNIYCIGISNNVLYVGGDFLKIGGQYRNRIAAINTITGLVKPWNPAIVNPGYSDIKFYKSKIIIGGGFGDGGWPGYVKHACALLDTVTGDTVNYVFDNAITSNYLHHASSVQQLAISGDTLFASSNGTYDTRITAIDLTAGNTVIWQKFFSMNSIASGLVCANGRLFIGGTGYNQIYRSDSPSVVQRKINNALALNMRTGDLVGWFPEPVGWAHDINTICMSANTLFLGGNFTHVNGFERPGLLLLKTSSEQILPFYANIDKPFPKVDAIKLIDSTLYIAGRFYSINGTGFNSSVASFNVNTAQLLPWHPTNMDEALSIEADANNVYLGGWLTEPTGGLGRTALFAIDRNTGNLTSWSPNPDHNDIRALHIADGKLYVGGNFTNISGQSRNHIACYDLSTMSLTSWAPSSSDEVRAITSSDTTIWVGGSFGIVPPSNSCLFGGIDAQSGEVIKRCISTKAGEVHSLIKKGVYVIAGGKFQSNTSSCNNLLMYNTVSSDTLAGTSFCEQFNTSENGINSMVITGNELYFGGSFNYVDGHIKSTNIGRVVYPTGFFESVVDTFIHFYPNHGGVGGDVTIHFTGEFIHNGVHMKLVHSGMSDIVGADSMTYYPENHVMNVTLDLTGAALGMYDVILIDTNGTQHIYTNGFTVEPIVAPKLWVNITGDPVLRIGFNQVYTVTYGNYGNIDAYLVPLEISGLPLGTKIELLNPVFKLDTIPAFDTVGFISDSFPSTIQNDRYSYRIFIVGKIATQSTNVMSFIFHLPDTTQLHIRPNIVATIGNMESDTSIDYHSINLKSSSSSSDFWNEHGECIGSIASAAASVLINALEENTIGDAARCIIGVHTTVISGMQALLHYTHANKGQAYIDAGHLSAGGLSWVLNCASMFPLGKIAKIVKYAKKASDLIDNGLTGYEYLYNCFKKDNTSNFCPLTGNAWDPNEKYGPGDSTNGFFLNTSKPISYTINFENQPTANLNAQTITVTDSLNATYYDYSSFAFTSVVFSDSVYTFNYPVTSFTHDFDLRRRCGVIARISGQYDSTTGIASWKFQTIDTLTNVPTTNALLGILPPDTTSPLGQGYVSFIVKPNSAITDGSSICNKATIVFDNNPPITTKCWENIYDITAPSSKVAPLPKESNSAAFTVSWTGTDNLSGIAAYDVYVSVNDSAYTLWRSSIAGTSDVFYGSFGNKYSFYSIATDKAGNMETKRDTAEATIKLTDNSSFEIFPNPNNGTFTVHCNSSLNVSGIALYDMYGKRMIISQSSTNQNTFTIQLNRTIPNGVYIIKVNTNNSVMSRRIVIEQ